MGILSFSALLHSWVSAIKTNTKELEILWKVKRKSCILIMCISVSYDVSINLALGSKRLRRLMFVNLRISTFELYLPTWFIWDHNNWLIIIMVLMTDLLQFKSICNSWKCLLLTWIWSLFLILLNSCKYKGQWLSVKSVWNKGKQKQRQHVSHLDDLFLEKKINKYWMRLPSEFNNCFIVRSQIALWKVIVAICYFTQECSQG